MTIDQSLLFGLLAVIFALLIWGRIRYDVVAFGALLAATLVGIVPASDAFDGFGHPATVIVALVLIVSRGLANSGAIEILSSWITRRVAGLRAHIAVMAGLSAVLSSFMNNVGALALLMPVDIQAAKQAGRSPRETLMPLSFASILGGLVTLIGTPPNVIVAAHREEALGVSFSMFAYTPVGGLCALAGVVFVALVGWRLIPKAPDGGDVSGRLKELKGFIAEVTVPEDAKIIGQRVRELDEAAEDAGVTIMGIVRGDRRLPGLSRVQEIRAADVLVIEAGPEAIERFVGALGLEYLRREADIEQRRLFGEDLEMVEVVVPQFARISGRSARSVGLLHRYGITLLGVSREGQPFRDRVRGLTIRPGDVLLLLGPQERLPEVTEWLGCMTLAERGTGLVQRDKAGLTIGGFGLMIALAGFGLVPLPVALGVVAVGLVLAHIVPLRQIYESVEWPVIVLLGAMIPLGNALQETGGTALIADTVIGLTEGWAPIAVLALLMVATMTLSDVLNNTATAVLAAPLAVDLATRLGVNADPFLMAVAVAASCAFLTPIGHKNNTLIMGPGGYRFGDYWRLGLPLEILVIAVAVPAITVFWPF